VTNGSPIGPGNMPNVTDDPGWVWVTPRPGTRDGWERRLICPSFKCVKIAVAKETREGESRVAMVPELVGKLTALGYDVAVEPEAGRHALITDEEYAEAGARVDEAALEGADVVVSVQPLATSRIRQLAHGTTVISFLSTMQEQDTVVDLRDCGVTSHAIELIPRISRAQSMDGLSSQSLVSGYRCAIVAAGMLRRFFPLNMTAAGTVKAAEVVVLGAGVAGLQAIATAKRLGAVVRAYDVRAAAAEEIRSMGAKAIELDLESLEGTGGYAREMTEDRAARQRELLTPYIAAADALITTAAVPGRTAPMLVTRDMVEQMRPGSVVVDLASESGGNVEGSVPGEVVRIGNAQVWGGRNVPGQMPGPASRLYAQNIVNLVTLMTGTDDEGTAAFAPDFDDEIVSGSCVTRDGTIVHAPTREAIEGSATSAHAEPGPASDSAPDPAPYDEGVADDDGMQPEGAVPADEQDGGSSAVETDLPYDQEADQ
jgi:NAD(P) transhydrogenase subunit alpha